MNADERGAVQQPDQAGGSRVQTIDAIREAVASSDGDHD